MGIINISFASFSFAIVGFNHIFIIFLYFSSINSFSL